MDMGEAFNADIRIPNISELQSIEKVSMVSCLDRFEGCLNLPFFVGIEIVHTRREAKSF
jgi:hypothetical protein